MKGSPSIVCVHSIGQSSIIWPYQPAKTSGKGSQLCAQEEKEMVLGDSPCCKYFLKYLGHHRKCGSVPAVGVSHSS